ncbi:hypothetical protein Bca4012_025245 [Brassica carinata]
MEAAKLGINEDVKFSDRISYLPNDLLLQILSLVPITDAVNTSILSKRWTSLWKMMPMLVYDANICPNIDSRSFEIFWRRSLKLHEAPVLQTLTIRPREHTFYHLKLPKSFPNTVFQKLVVLKLYNIVSLRCSGKSPVCFRSLKSLHLTRVSFRGEKYFCRLISSCPVLEELFLDRALPLIPATVSILEIKDYASVRSYPSPDSRFKINAPSLKYFKLYINGSNFEFYEDLPKLVEASLLVDSSQTDNLLRFLTTVEFLSIHLYATKSIESEPESPSKIENLSVEESKRKRERI